MEPLTVAGTMDSLSSIGEYVLQATAAAGLDKKRAYRLRLAVDEIATNIVEHGYECVNLEGNLTVSAELTSDFLTITLEDTSTPFDPRGMETDEATFLSAPLEEKPIGQLGILLTLRVLDHFDYQSTPNGNRSIFVMRRTPDLAAAPPQ